MNGQDVPVTRARFNVRRYGKVLAVGVYGLVTVESVRDARQIIICEEACRETTKALVDLRLAIMLLHDEDWQQLSDPGEVWPKCQVGLIVQPENLQAANRYTSRMLERNDRERLAFSAEPQELELALAWAQLPAAAVRDGAAETRRNMPWLRHPPATEDR